MPKQARPDWDALAERFNTTDFITHDPIQFAHRFKRFEDQELAGFIAAMFSYGQRPLILNLVEQLLHPLGHSPAEGLMTLSDRQISRLYPGLVYRFNTTRDMRDLMRRLQGIYIEYGSLKQFWKRYTSQKNALASNISTFREVFCEGLSETYGLKFLLADPAKNSAAKRFNMFLRWMVRHDAVDLGLWQDVLKPSQLIFPLDTHVAVQARHFGITQRKSNDWKTAEAITAYFRERCAEDPVKYDFALFGLGIESAKMQSKTKR